MKHLLAAGVFSLLLLSGSIHAFADGLESGACERLLSGDLVAQSVRELAKLRFDLDQRQAAGLSDAVTRALESEYRKKESEIRSLFAGQEADLRLQVKAEIDRLQSERSDHAEEQVRVRQHETEAMDEAETSVVKIADIQEPRFGHAQTVLPDGTVLLSGGQGSNGLLTSIERVDPVRKTSTKIGDLKEARGYHIQILAPNGKVQVISGWGRFLEISSSTEWIDDSTGKTQAGPKIPVFMNQFKYSILPDGQILVSKEIIPLSSAADNVSDLLQIDPVKGKVTKLGQLKVSREGHAQSTLPDGAVVISGGRGAGKVLSSIERFDPVTKTDEIVGNLLQARGGHAQSTLPDGRILVSGGYDGKHYLSSIELIDLDKNTVEPLGFLSTPRAGHTQSVLPDGTILVSGGSGANGPCTSIELIKVGRQ